MITIRNRYTYEIILEQDTLTGADLRGANLRFADLTGADLALADLRGADFTGADLEGADLEGADLRYADLTRANLRHADLTGADLTRADLTEANLTGADLSYANIINTRGIYTIQLDRGLIIAHATQVQIGCEKHSIDHWLEHYKEIGKKNNYTDKQIEIYGKQLDVIELLLAEYIPSSNK